MLTKPASKQLKVNFIIAHGKFSSCILACRTFNIDAFNSANAARREWEYKVGRWKNLFLFRICRTALLAEREKKYSIKVMTINRIFEHRGAEFWAKLVSLRRFAQFDCVRLVKPLPVTPVFANNRNQTTFFESISTPETADKTFINPNRIVHTQKTLLQSLLELPFAGSCVCFCYLINHLIMLFSSTMDRDMSWICYCRIVNWRASI